MGSRLTLVVAIAAGALVVLWILVGRSIVGGAPDAGIGAATPPASSTAAAVSATREAAARELESTVEPDRVPGVSRRTALAELEPSIELFGAVRIQEAAETVPGYVARIPIDRERSLRGSVELTVVTGAQRRSYTAPIVDGRYSVTVHERGRIELGRPRVHGREVCLIRPGPIVGWPDGGELDLLLGAGAPVALVVRAALGMHKLDGVDVLALRSTPPGMHPGPVPVVGQWIARDAPGRVLLTNGLGPFARQSTRHFYVRAPGHAWTFVNLGHMQRRPVLVDLQPAGDVRVAIRAPESVALPRTLRLRLEHEFLPIWTGPIEGPGPHHFHSVRIGTTRAVLLQGSTEIAESTAELEPGGRIELDLEVSDVDPGGAADLNVALRVPRSWPLDRVRMAVETSVFDARRNQSPPLQLARAGTREVEHRFSGLTCETVDLVVHPMGFATTIDHRGPGVQRLTLPDYGQIEIAALDAASGEELPTATVRWSATVGGRPWKSNLMFANLESVRTLPAGRVSVVVSASGYADSKLVVDVTSGPRRETVLLQPSDPTDDSER